MDGFLDTLRRSGGVNAVANQLDIPPAVAASGVEALLPAVLEGFNRSVERGGEATGRDELMELLGELGGGYMAAELIHYQRSDSAPGERILTRIFGSPGVSRAVADEATRHCPLDAALLRRMLPPLAMLVGGYLAARVSSGQTVEQLEVGAISGRLAEAEAVAARGGN